MGLGTARTERTRLDRCTPGGDQEFDMELPRYLPGTSASIAEGRSVEASRTQQSIGAGMKHLIQGENNRLLLILALVNAVGLVAVSVARFLW